MNDVPTSRGPSRFRGVLLALALPVFIYIAGFVALLQDSYVFRTNYFRHLPVGVRDVIRMIYDPLMRLLLSL